MGMSSVEYVKHADISSQQWDQCIKCSFNGSVQAYSWYLNLFCDQWDALVEGDYKSVMPLPVKKKFGQPVVYMPPFINQLGIYSPECFTVSKTTAFLDMLKRKFHVVNMGINKYTPLPTGIFHWHDESFCELDLIRPYSKTVTNYSPSCRNMLRLATARQYNVISGIAPNDIITFIKKEKVFVDSAVREDDFKKLRMLIASLLRYKTGELFGIYNNVNMLSCIAVFLWSNNNVILMFAAATKEAIADHAPLLLCDKFIEKYSENNVTLLFEFRDKYLTPDGYRGFGAAESHYQRLHLNRIPFFLRPLIK